MKEETFTIAELAQLTEYCRVNMAYDNDEVGGLFLGMGGK